MRGNDILCVAMFFVIPANAGISFFGLKIFEKHVDMITGKESILR